MSQTIIKLKTANMSKKSAPRLFECIDNKPLEGNDHAPLLEIGKTYSIQEITKCGCGKEHYHVGLESTLNYVTCHSCKEELPDGDKKHGCHPSRFKAVDELIMTEIDVNKPELGIITKK